MILKDFISLQNLEESDYSRSRSNLECPPGPLVSPRPLCLVESLSSKITRRTDAPTDLKGSFVPERRFLYM